LKGIGTSLETTQIGTAPVHGQGHAQEAGGRLPDTAPSAGRSLAGAIAGYALWVLLWALVVLWAAFLWHPWIDWFGRVRLSG
jgi:hypothetical protein